MVLLTATSLKNLSQNGKVTLALYYVVPRSLMAIAFFYVSTNVNRVVRKSMENAWKMKQDRHYEGDTEFILRYICRR